jgi:hypothetical protein
MARSYPNNGGFAIFRADAAGDKREPKESPMPNAKSQMKSLDGKLILALSLFGLAMGILTVFVIPSNIEPIFWVAIFLVCAYLIAKKAPGRFFLHGFLVSLVNGVWITGAHIALFDSYLPRHPNEAAMMSSMPMPNAPRLMMLMTGPVVALVSGLVLGLFAFIASKLVKKRA